LNKLILTLSLTLTLLLGSLSLAAQTELTDELPDNVPALQLKANSAYSAKDYLTYRNALQRLRAMRPNNSEYMYQLVIAHALLDEKSAAYSLMLEMQQSGLAYDFSMRGDVDNIRGTEAFDYINDLMKMAAEPLGESESVFTLPESVATPEAIAWDESRQSFLVATVAEGGVYAVSEAGEVNELITADEENGMWAIFGILVDQKRNRLWITSAATAAFSGFDPTQRGRSGLFEFNLQTLELVRRYPVPVDGRAHVLGSMALGPEGDIYIVDRALPIIYSKPAGEEKLIAEFAFRDMISMRGVAIQPDGGLLYVADREMGIMVVDVKAKKAGKVAVPDTLSIGGIDGLYLWDNHLVMIQNGIKPQRVMRMELDQSGTKVSAVRPLAVAQPDFDFPSFGTLKGKDLYYFANSHRAGGDAVSKPVTVVRTSVDSNEDLAKPDMMDYLKQRGEAQEEALRKKG